MPIIIAMHSALTSVALAYPIWLTLGVLVAAKGWYWDPARGRSRCRRCSYPMNDAFGLLCPECGRQHRRGSDLRRLRHSPPLIAIGVGLILWSGYARMAVAHQTWAWPVSVNLLLGMGARWSGGSVLDRELKGRMESSLVSDDEFAMIMRRECPYDGTSILQAIRTRDTWPRSVPFGLWFASTRGADTTFPLDAPSFDLVIESLIHPELRTEARIDRFGGIYPAHAVVGLLGPDGTYGIKLSVFRRYRDRPVTLFTTELHGAVAIVEDDRDGLVGVADTSIAGAVRSTFMSRMYVYVSLHEFPTLHFSSSELSKTPPDVALALRIQLLRGDVLAGEAVYIHNTQRSFHGEVACQLRASDHLMSLLKQSDVVWTVRVVGDRGLALRNPAATSFWDGTVLANPNDIGVEFEK